MLGKETVPSFGKEISAKYRKFVQQKFKRLFLKVRARSFSDLCLTLASLQTSSNT